MKESEVINVYPQETSVATHELQDQFISNFKSLYYMFNASPDTQTQIFDDNKLVTIDDIYELDGKVSEKFRTHDVIVNSISIIVTFINGKSKEFNNWQEFNRTDWNVSLITKSVNIQWDFFIKLPNYKTPQRHTVKIRIGSKLRPEELFKLIVESDNEHELEKNIADLVCKIDFVNAVICDELMNIVKEWYQGLQKDLYNNKIAIFYEKHSKRISTYLDRIFPLISIVIVYSLTNIYLNDYADNFNITTTIGAQKLLLWLTLSSSFIYIFRLVGHTLANYNYRKAKKFVSSSDVIITKGDKNKMQEAILRNKSLVRDISINILASTIFAIVTFAWGLFQKIL